MEWQTHFLSGVVVGYAVTGGDWKGAIVGGVAGVISDLDEPKSKFGKILLPVSIPLNQVFGHRTMTHSLVFTLIVGGLVALFSNPLYGLATVGGILAHIAGDMLTGKVKLLYPLKTSIGLSIPGFLFLPLDRLFRYSLLGISVIYLYLKIK